MSTDLAASAARDAAVDEMPYDRSALSQLTADERCAVYLNSIRKMLVFFTVLVLLGIIAGVVIGIIDINTLHSVNPSSTNGFGQP